MADINLLQGQVKGHTLLSDRRTGIFNFIAVILAAVLVGVAVLLYFLEGSTAAKTEDLNTKNAALLQQINTQQAGLGDAKAYQAKLANIELLLNNHIYFTPLIKELTDFTFQKSQYLTLDAGQDTKKIHIEGRVDNYSDLGKLLLGFSTSKNFTNVKLLSVVPSQGVTTSYLFSLDMTVAPTIFIQQ